MCADHTPQPMTSRRRAIEVFLGGGLLASLASFIYPVLRFLVPPAVIDLGGDEVVAAKVAEMKPNTGKIFRFGSRPGLLILNNDGTYRALSATCTHLGCTVQYRPDLREIWCACHNGIYDLNGRNVSGPPQDPSLCSTFTCVAMKLSSTGSGRRDGDIRPHTLAR